MKRCGPWLFVGFVLAILLVLGIGPNRPTRMFLDSPIGRASCLDVSHLFVPAAVLFKPAKFSLYLQARRSRAGPNECLPLPSNLSLDHTPLRADDTDPPWIDLRGPQCWFQRPLRLKLQGTAGPADGPRKEKLPSEPAKTRPPARIGVLQRVIFTTGFS